MHTNTYKTQHNNNHPTTYTSRPLPPHRPTYTLTPTRHPIVIHTVQHIVMPFVINIVIIIIYIIDGYVYSATYELIIYYVYLIGNSDFAMTDNSCFLYKIFVY